MDAISEQRLAQVNPVLAAKVRAMAAELVSQGIYIRVVQGLRTWAEQNADYAKVPRVTHAKGGQSWHNFGMAVDCVPGIRGDDPWAPNWVATHPDYAAMIAAGEAQGLVSGSRWVTMKDEPHFQLSGIPVSPMGVHRELFAAKGLQGVWDAVGDGSLAV